MAIKQLLTADRFLFTIPPNIWTAVTRTLHIVHLFYQKEQRYIKAFKRHL
jgi:hypothetical protein